MYTYLINAVSVLEYLNVPLLKISKFPEKFKDPMLECIYVLNRSYNAYMALELKYSFK